MKTKIQYKRLILKSVEEGIKKAIEYALLALIVGVTLKFVIAVIPAAMIGTIIAKFAKINLFSGVQ